MHMTFLLNLQNFWSRYKLWMSHLWGLYRFRGTVSAKTQRWWNKTVIMGTPCWVTTQHPAPGETRSQLAFFSALKYNPRSRLSFTGTLMFYCCSNGSSPRERERERERECELLWSYKLQCGWAGWKTTKPGMKHSNRAWVFAQGL